MRLHRFYTKEKIPAQGGFTIADKALVNQLKNVFKLRTGDSVIVFNGDGQDNECVIEGFLKDELSLKIQASIPSRFMPAREVWLCAAIVKKDNFEWIAEKATELGVTRILPIVSERSEKKSLNMERLQKIVIEASEQSGRGDVPKIEPILKLEEGLEYLKSQAPGLQVVMFHTEGEIWQERAFNKDKSIAVFVGPEGGWSEREVELFHKDNVPVVCLGRQVLRAETAVVAILARIVF